MNQFKTIRERIIAHVEKTLDAWQKSEGLELNRRPQTLAPPKQKEHGDFACTTALALAKPLKRNPRDIAEMLRLRLGDCDGLVEKIDIAGPGYLNFFVNKDAWRKALIDMIETGADYTRSDWGAGENINLEFVSANPTGPLHFAHGRGAVQGDIVGRLLKATGHQVVREYYINDLGHQTDVMARSLHLRYQEACGRTPEHPEEFYPGEYLVPIAQNLKDKHGEGLLDQAEENWLEEFKASGISAMLLRIKEDLLRFGVEFDAWTSERELTQRVGLDGVLNRIEKAGFIFEEDSKKWFRSTDFKDDKDRVVVRDDGRTTYFASDIAYHDDKLKRGSHHLINVWGADHGGYIARVRAGMQALGYEPSQLEVLLIQMVSLSRGGEAVKMGKRLGTAVWLKDVMDEAGVDATRYLFAMRSTSSQMDFDLELATKKTMDNPVFYAQMGHARMCSIARRALEADIATPKVSFENTSGLGLAEEFELIKLMQLAPDVVSDAARAREPHKVCHYLQEMISAFHSYYTQYSRTERVISDDPQKTRARLLLCMGLRLTMHTLLADILGVSAPEAMFLSEEAQAERER